MIDGIHEYFFRKYYTEKAVKAPQKTVAAWFRRSLLRFRIFVLAGLVVAQRRSGQLVMSKILVMMKILNIVAC